MARALREPSPPAPPPRRAPPLSCACPGEPPPACGLFHCGARREPPPHPLPPGATHGGHDEFRPPAAGEHTGAPPPSAGVQGGVPNGREVGTRLRLLGDAFQRQHELQREQRGAGGGVFWGPLCRLISQLLGAIYNLHE